jgi:hypothetical protein
LFSIASNFIGLNTWNGTDLGAGSWYQALAYNGTNNAISILQPGDMSLHPGASGQFSAVEWTAPSAGTYQIQGIFSTTGATTDVHVYAGATALFNDFLNLNGQDNVASYFTTLSLNSGDKIDFLVGYGNGNFSGDTTLLDATISAVPVPGAVWLMGSALAGLLGWKRRGIAA